MVEKNMTTDTEAQIAFNWERVKKKVERKREELVANSPNVLRRSMLEEKVNTIAPALPDTSDSLIDPFDYLPSNSVMTASNPAPHRSVGDTIPNKHKDIKLIGIDQDVLDGTRSAPDGTTRPSDGTTRPSALSAAPARSTPGTLEVIEERRELDSVCGPDRNAVELLQAIKEGLTTGKELTQDERRLVVRSLRELGQTQDAIAQLLKVSRRTVVNDYKLLRQQLALEIQHTDTHDIAGEVYETAKVCIRRALAAGHFKTVSTIMRDMVEVLQSLGVVYEAPKRSMTASLVGKLQQGQAGYQHYMKTIGDDKDKVVEVLDCLFNSIGSGNA